MAKLDWKVLIPLFRSFIFTMILKIMRLKNMMSFNPFIQVFYFYNDSENYEAEEYDEF